MLQRRGWRLRGWETKGGVWGEIRTDGKDGRAKLTSRLLRVQGSACRMLGGGKEGRELG
jgi:hypothetical protein